MRPPRPRWNISSNRAPRLLEYKVELKPRPADLGDVSEEVRLRFRAKALQSTYFMGKAVLGFNDMTPHTHGPMCKFIESPSKRKLGLAPRDHLKTSVWTIADTVRRISANPNIRILLGNETATNASHFLRRIEAVYERNEMYQWLFPELIPDFSKVKKWSETEMLVPRSDDFPESTVECIGVGGAVVSRHYDLLKLDDLVGKEASESEEVMRKTIDWYIYCESLLIDPRESEIHNYGTRWAYYDLHAWADEHEAGAEKFFRSAHLPDGTAFWPERFPLEVLDKIRAKYGSFKFSCQYMNSPHDPESTSFNEKWLRFYTFENETCKTEHGAPNWKAMRRFMRVDPAISEADRACETAICVDAVDFKNNKFLLDTWTKRCHPSEMFDQIFTLAQVWDVESVGVESVAYQKALKHFLDQEAERRGVYLNIVELRPDTRRSKQSRIRALQPYFERGEIYIRQDQQKFIEQYVKFPTGKDVDLLDAFAYGPVMWGLPEEPGDEDEEATFTMFRNQMHEGRDAWTGY